MLAVAELGGERHAGADLDIGDHHLGAHRVKGANNGGADTRRAAGHDRDLAREPPHPPRSHSPIISSVVRMVASMASEARLARCVSTLAAEQASPTTTVS